MLDLRHKSFADLPIATARVPVDGRYQVVAGRVVAQTYEKDPMLDLRLESGAIVHVRLSEAEVASRIEGGQS